MSRLSKILVFLGILYLFIILPLVAGGAMWIQNVGLLSGTSMVFASDAPAVDRMMASVFKSVYGNRIGICDGTATDGTVANAAFNALPGLTGRLVFSTGYFNMSVTGLNITSDYSVIVVGQGDSTIISGGGINTPVSFTGTCYRGQLRDMTIRGGAPYCVNSQAVEATFDNLRLKGGFFPDACLYQNGSGTSLTNSRIEEWKNGGYGVYNKKADTVVDQCYFNSMSFTNTGWAYYADGATPNITIKESAIETFYGGIYSSTNETHVENIYFEGGHYNDVSLACSNFNVTGCYSNGNGDAAHFVSIVGNDEDFGIVEDNRSTGHTDCTIYRFGINYGNMHYTRNRAFGGEVLGVVQDEDKYKYIAQVPSVAQSADINCPFAEDGGTISHNLQDRFKYTGDGNKYCFDILWTGGPTFTSPAVGNSYVTVDGSQYGSIGSADNYYAPGGSRTYFFVVTPNFLETENVEREIFHSWTSDGNNEIEIRKDDNAAANVVYVYWKGAGTARTASATLGFAQNEIMIIAAVAEVGGYLKLYYQGRLVSTSPVGVVGFSGNATTTRVGSDRAGNRKFKGTFLRMVDVPYAMTDSQVMTTTEELAAIYDVVVENSGTATILNATTSIVVPHGLAATPTRVYITRRNNPTNAVTFEWVDTAGAVNFTINCDADPGASGVIYDWRAYTGEGG